MWLITQHSPLSHISFTRNEANFFKQIFNKWFHKNVCNIIFRMNMMYLNIPMFDKFAKKMMPNVNMLTATMKLHVTS